MCELGELFANWANFGRVSPRFVTLIREKFAPDARFANFHQNLFFSSEFHQIFLIKIWTSELLANFSRISVTNLGEIRT